MKKFLILIKGWKTLAFNILAASVPLLQLTEWHDVIPARDLPYYALGVALANAVLRHITDTKVGYKKDRH